MSHEDELAFARYLKEGDKELSQAYQDQGGEQPSIEMDRTILAAAKAQAEINHGSKIKRSVRRNWGAPFAVAATVVLAIGLVNIIPKEQRLSTPITVMESDTIVPLQKQPPMDAAKQDRKEMRSDAFVEPAASAVSASDPVKAKRKLEKKPSQPAAIKPQLLGGAVATDEAFSQSKKSNTPMRRDMPMSAPMIQAPAEAGIMMDEMKSRQRIQKMESLKAQSEMRSRSKTTQEPMMGIMAEEEVIKSKSELKGRMLEESAARDLDDSVSVFKEVYFLIENGREQEARQKLNQYAKQYPNQPIPDDLKPYLQVVNENPAAQ